MIAMEWVLVLWMIGSTGAGSTVVVGFNDGTACETWRARLVQRFHESQPAAVITGMCMPRGTYPVPGADEVGPNGQRP